jgi:hypothetical protein
VASRQKLIRNYKFESSSRIPDAKKIDNRIFARYCPRRLLMSTLRDAVVPGFIAGVVSTFASWLWMGVIFHRYQRETPNTWRSEGPRSYVAASLVRIFAAFGIACLFVLIVRFNIAFFGAGLIGNLRFALCIWGAISLPIVLESAIFIRLHPMVVFGQLLDWLSTSVLACVITGWWLHR